MGARRIHSVETVENFRQGLGRNALAGIGNFDADSGPVSSGSQCRPQHDRAAGWRVRDGIRNQIANRPLQESAVQLSDDWLGSNSRCERDAAILGGSLVVFPHTVEHLGDIHLFAMHVGQRAFRMSKDH